MKNNMMVSTLLSLALLTVNVTASSSMTCKDGKCFIDLSRFGKIDKVSHFKNSIKKPTISEANIVNDIELEIDKDTIRLPHEKYVMNALEKEKYEESTSEIEDIEIKAMDKEDLLNILAEINAMDEEDSTLPVSDKYCDLKNAKYDSVSDTYECS